jgi:hypothetical protein
MAKPILRVIAGRPIQFDNAGAEAPVLREEYHALERRPSWLEITFQMIVGGIALFAAAFAAAVLILSLGGAR